MKNDSKFKRIICALLVLGLLAGSPCVSAFADDGGETTQESAPKEEPKHEEPKKEEPKKEEPKPEPPKEEPKKEEPKPDNPGNQPSDNPSGGNSAPSEPSKEPSSDDNKNDTGSGQSQNNKPASKPAATPAPKKKEEKKEKRELTGWRKQYSSWYGVVDCREQGMDIPVYYQTDFPETLITIEGVPRSVASSGCGITCMSMVIAYLTGNTEQTPTSLFKEAIRGGLYKGAGWSHEALTEFGRRYGVHTRWIGNDEKAIRQALKEGKPIIAHMGPGIFTKHGHYVLLRGIASSGKILMNDPVSIYKTAKAFPILTLFAQARVNNSFCICWTDAMIEAQEDAIPMIEESIDPIENEELPEAIDPVDNNFDDLPEEVTDPADEVLDDIPEVIPDDIPEAFETEEEVNDSEPYVEYEVYEEEETME